ncbi:hypothetical protein B0A48_07797 [Cryoendolithus antarcticus]|uniref:HTH La-type RNA-binding domain-containing protein n=1 Tax=Cryoendolithus antarcticus TaxID=1507870 RepID=A0A1V8T752_9PEZI|nr:hypothetical protein B0A48_07797 [Cryoendolithus antarcticus]
MAEIADKPTESVAEQVVQKANEVVETVKEAVANGSEKVTEVASAAAEKVSEAATNGGETANEAVKDVAEKVNGDADKGNDDSRKRPGSFNSDRRDKRSRGDRNGGSYNSRGGGDRNGKPYNSRGGGFSRGNSRGNAKVRSRFENQPESKDEGEIRRQVEFYFSDSNLPMDKYLLELTGGKENKPVPLKTIHDFKRMRHFQPYSAVRDAVAASAFLELSEDDEITRKVALADKFSMDVEENRTLAQTNMMARSAYVKGFPEEHERTHLDIEEFFAPYGPVQSVRLRRHDDGEFKGSIFVEFETEALLKAFLELDPAPEFDGKTLQIMSKQVYVDKKTEGIHDGTVKPRSPRRESGGQRGGKFQGDKDNWNERRDHDRRSDRGRGQRGGPRGGQRGRGQGRDRDGGERRGGYRDVEKDSEPKSAGELLGRAEAEAKRAAETVGEKMEGVATSAGAEGAKEKVEGAAEVVKEKVQAAVAEVAGTKRSHDGEGEQGETKKAKGSEEGGAATE